MSRNFLGALGAAVVALVVVAWGSLFTVPQQQQALVLQFGDPKRVIQEPGLKVKLPFIQDVQYFEKRILDIDPPKQQVILIDQKRLDVDAYGRYRITDPLRFYQTVNNEAGARARLGAIINSAMRRVLGNESLTNILSFRRGQITQAIFQEVNQATQPLGIEMIDVRIKRADYPDQTSQAIYARMKSERDREAREFRGEGSEVAQQIRADADRQRVVIVATAQQQAQTLRGEGDAQAIRLYAEAFGQDPQFFAFYRSMEAYKQSLGDGSTTLVLTPDSEFFRFFNDLSGKGAPGR
ncbi:MAG: protease modulator HflC [Alphaproteobacteria bacterium]|nr:protease modulator HflC [Alphaproteobacteria bacterium]